MTRVLRSTPAALAVLVLGAHFYRNAAVVPALVCVAAVALVFVRRPGAVLAVRLGLAAGSVLWIVTAWRIARVRIQAGMPYVRMLVILGAVAAFTAIAAWVVPPSATPPPRDRERS
jgi:hypothetical protein